MAGGCAMGGQVSIDFSDKKQCLALLETLNVMDTEHVCATLKRLLKGLQEQAPEPIDHLQVIEESRVPLAVVLDQLSQRYATRPLSPTSEEDATLQDAVLLLQAMADNYGLISARSIFDHAFAKRRSLLTQRRMLYTAQMMIEFFRARREVPKTLWHSLHEQFVAGERAGTVDVRVTDALNETWGAQSAQEAFVMILLIDVANPYNRTPREFAWIVRWAQRFASYCTLVPTATDVPSMYALDIGQDRGLLAVSLMGKKSELARGLETSKLASHIRGVVSQLRKGVPASDLGLGNDCVPSACARLLVSLYRLWGLATVGRKFPRRPVRGNVDLILDTRGIAFFIDQREFTEPVDEVVSNFMNTQALLLFGERAENIVVDEGKLAERAAQLGYVPEVWCAVDQSATGCRLVRHQSGSRIEHRQVVGLRHPDGEGMYLAEICWVQYDAQGSLRMGLHIMTGRPKVIAVRRDLGGQRERYQLGFSLFIQGLEPSLVVPVGWYVAGRKLDLRQGDDSWSVEMVKLLSRGSNFDRVSFVRS